MRARNKVVTGLVSLVTAGVLIISGSTSASAAETGFGAYSCGQGSITTKSNTTYGAKHFLYQGGQLKQKTFADSGVLRKANQWYSSVYASTSGGVQTVGTIYSASINCAD